MGKSKFDQDAADQFVQELGEAIVASPNYAPHDWESISLVINLDGEVEQFGYVYLIDGSWKGETPGYATLKIAPKLREAMKVKGQKPWKQCLYQVTRDGRVAVDFDYDGDQWIPDMSNPEKTALGLKIED